MTAFPSVSVLEPFVGAGGMALGLSRAGLSCAWACDMDPRAVATAVTAGIPAIEARLDDALAAQVGGAWLGIDLVAGGPPCQPFSVAGKAQGGQDSRDGFPAFLALVREARPRAVLIENVPGLLRPGFSAYLASITDQLGALKMHVVRDGGRPGRVLDAADFGVPQRRRRIFIVALRDPADAARFCWPAPTHHQSGLVWAKWGSAGEIRGGVEGGSYWREHGMEGPAAPATGRRPWGGKEDPKHPTHDPDAPMCTLRRGGNGMPTEYVAGVVAVDGSPVPGVVDDSYWREHGMDGPATGRSGDVHPGGRRVTESRSGTFRIEYPLHAPTNPRGPSDAVRRHAVSAPDNPAPAQRQAPSYLAPGCGSAGPSREEARVLREIVAGRVEVRGPRWLTVRDALGGGLVAPGPRVLGVVSDTGAARIASRPVSSVDAPSPAVRGGSVAKGGGGGGVLWALPPDAPEAERAVDMAAGAPCALVRNTGKSRAPEIVDPDAPAKVLRDESRDQFLTQSQIRVLVGRRANAAIGICDDTDLLGIACRRGRESAGGSSQPFIVVGAGTNPHGPGREAERTRRRIEDEPAPTMTAEQFGKQGPWIGEGSKAIGLRRLSPAECAALQGFPADWPWQGPKTSVYRQVGNACPPAMAEAVGRAVAAVLAPTPHGIARTDEGGPEQSPLLDGEE